MKPNLLIVPGTTNSLHRSSRSFCRKKDIDLIHVYILLARWPLRSQTVKSHQYTIGYWCYLRPTHNSLVIAQQKVDPMDDHLQWLWQISSFVGVGVPSQVQMRRHRGAIWKSYKGHLKTLHWCDKAVCIFVPSVCVHYTTLVTLISPVRHTGARICRRVEPGWLPSQLGLTRPCAPWDQCEDNNAPAFVHQKLAMFLSRARRLKGG